MTIEDLSVLEHTRTGKIELYLTIVDEEGFTQIIHYSGNKDRLEGDLCVVYDDMCLKKAYWLLDNRIAAHKKRGYVHVEDPEKTIPVYKNIVAEIQDDTSNQHIEHRKLSV